MTSGDVPILLVSIRRMATQLLEQTAVVEQWVADCCATYDEIVEHQAEDLCDCDTRAPALCDQHAAVMLMVGGPMDGHVYYHRLASSPPSRWFIRLYRRPSMAWQGDPVVGSTRALAEYELSGRVVTPANVDTRIYHYTLVYADDVRGVA